MYIISGFATQKLIVCNGKDPPWFNTKMKSFINEKIKTYKDLRKKIEHNHQIEKLKFLLNRLKGLIEDSKPNYYSRLANKLLSIQMNSKLYWSI